jgi:hypothetical protein
MSGTPFDLNYDPNNPYAGMPGLSEMLGGIGGSGGGGGGSAGGGFDLTSLDDPWQRFQAQSILDGQGLQREQLDIMRQGAAPPSKWATGAQTFGSIAQGLAGLGNIYLGLQGMKQQKKAFEFNKGVVNTNLNNSITDYNRRLNDTLQNRALNNGGGQGYVTQQMSQWSAKRS